MTASPAAHRETAEAALRWVLDQVRWDADGPWVPESVTVDPVAGAADGAASGAATPPDGRRGIHSGTGGLALLLAEVRLARPWTTEEATLAAAVADQLRAATATETEVSFFDGLAGTLSVLLALGEPGAEAVIERLLALATPDGWPTPWLEPPTYAPDARICDATLGTAGVLLAAAWAHWRGVPRADELATHAAAVLLAETEETADGPRWLFVPRRFRDTPLTEMPGWSHGQAGIAAALAVAGSELGRPDLLEAARRGTERLLTLADTTGGGFTVPRYVPPLESGDDPVSYGWCHGAAGTSQVFAALRHAGVADVGGRPPEHWQRAALRSVRAAGVPARLRPGHWDNDGQCCGTAGVGDLLLDLWQRDRDGDHLAYAVELGDALVSRAQGDGPRRWWRFVEHRAEQPLLPPGVGWMQGAAGITAYLLRLARLLEQGPDAPAVERADTWWARG